MVLLALLLVAVSLGVALRSRSARGGETTTPRSGTGNGDPTGRRDDSGSVVVTPPDVTPDADLHPESTVAPDDDADPEEYILGLLAAHGGRMRQQWIVDARDWSETVVSQHLTRMEERGLVVRYSLGRENAVCLPEYALDDRR